MALSVQGLAAALQTLLIDGAEKAAKDARFVLRKRKITGAGFVQALVLGWLDDPDAKLDDLAAPLGVAAQSLQERFDSRAVDCLRRVFKEVMGCLFAARPETIPLLRRFTEVCIEDGSSIALPASLADAYPGCGGPGPHAGRAGLKILVQLEALTGRIRVGEPAPARASDHALHASLPPPPSGSLRLADLGFFDLKRMAEDDERGVFWISRVPAGLKISRHGEPPRSVARWLGRQETDRIDAVVALGVKDRLTCRLAAVRTPKDVAAERLRRLQKKLKKKGRKLSEEQRILCRWTVMVTNLCDADRFPAEQLRVLYRVRWQIELVFKRWKSDGGLARSRGRTANRVVCEFLAKLMAVMIKHWATLLRGGPLCVVSAARAGARVKRWAGGLAQAVGSGRLEAVVNLLDLLKADLDRLPKRPRRARPTTRQSLFAPRFTA
jgi:hypothetical protein